MGKPLKKTYKCSEVGSKCQHNCNLAPTNAYGLRACLYILDEGHSRGCDPEECDKFKARKRSTK